MILFILTYLFINAIDILIYCFLDYDDTGIRDSDKYFELGIQPIFTMEKQHKDPSDYIKGYGNHKLIELINSQI